MSVKDFGATTGNVLSTVNTIVSNTASGDLLKIECDPETSIAPQDITGIRNLGKSLAITHYENDGLLKLFQHNQGPYGTNGVVDNEYNFSATDHSAVVIETINRATDGTRINLDRADTNPRPDNCSLVYRTNDFADLPKNTFQLNVIRSAEDLTGGAEQPEIDGIGFTPWHYDTNASSYSTKTNAIYIQKFENGNSQVEANRTAANLTGNVGINTYDPKGYKFATYSGNSSSNQLLTSLNSDVKQTFLNVSAATPDFHYDQTQNAAYNFGLSYLTGGTYGRSYAYIRPSATGASLGTDITNGVQFAHTAIDGNSYKSRVVGQQFELGSSVISSNPLWTSGSGSPEGVLTAVVGSIYSRTDGGANTTLYVKESGTGNTGWVEK